MNGKSADNGRMNMNVVYKWNGMEFSVEVESLPKESVAYLLQNGWSQSLQDSFAGARAKAVNDGEDEDTVNAVIEASIRKRMASILEGKLSASQGNGRDPIRSTALAMLELTTRTEGHTNFGKRLPKDKNKLKVLLDRYIEKHREEIKAEISVRRQKKSSEEISLDDFEVESAPAPDQQMSGS